VDKFIKRIQSRLSYQKISVSKSLVRETYESIVKNPVSPTEAEISQVIEALKSQEETPETSQLAMTAQSETIEITPQSHLDIWETLQPPNEQPETNTLD
jgi:predicted nucleic acid-binding protein